MGNLRLGVVNILLEVLLFDDSPELAQAYAAAKDRSRQQPGAIWVAPIDDSIYSGLRETVLLSGNDHPPRATSDVGRGSTTSD